MDENNSLVVSNHETILPEYPAPFKVKDGCLYREMNTKYGTRDVQLCNFLPFIVSEITLDDGATETKRLRLGGIKQNGQALPEIELAGSELASFNWLIEQWGSDCILEIGASVKDTIRYAIQQTAARAERMTVYSVTGWKKISGIWHFLMPGNSELTVKLPSKLKRYEQAEALNPSAYLTVSSMLDQPPAPKEVIYPLLAYTFLTPLNHFLHMVDCEPKFVLMLIGKTGARKSTLAALFLSFFGRFEASDLPMSFQDTANSIVHHAFALKDVLTCIDDFHPSGRQDEQRLTATLQKLIRSYGDRVGRGRLNADSTPMDARPPQGNAIITAEFPPDLGESGTARFFALELRAGEVDLKLLTAYQVCARNGELQCFMLAYLEWLRREFLSSPEMEKRFLSFLRRRFEEYRDEFIQTGIPCHGRLPEIVAWLQLGMYLFLSFLKSILFLTEDQVSSYEADFVCMLYALAKKQAASIEQDKPAHIFVRKLMSLIESGQVSVLDKDDPPSVLPKDYVGYEDDSYFYLNSDTAQRAVRKLCEDQGEQFSVTTKGLLKALAEEGLIETGKGQNTKPVRVGTELKRLVWLKKDLAKLIADGGMG